MKVKRLTEVFWEWTVCYKMTLSVDNREYIMLYSLAATVCLLLHEWGSCQSKQFAIKFNRSNGSIRRGAERRTDERTDTFVNNIYGCRQENPYLKFNMLRKIDREFEDQCIPCDVSLSCKWVCQNFTRLCYHTIMLAFIKTHGFIFFLLGCVYCRGPPSVSI